MAGVEEEEEEEEEMEVVMLERTGVMEVVVGREEPEENDRVVLEGEREGGRLVIVVVVVVVAVVVVEVVVFEGEEEEREREEGRGEGHNRYCSGRQSIASDNEVLNVSSSALAATGESTTTDDVTASNLESKGNLLPAMSRSSC